MIDFRPHLVVGRNVFAVVVTNDEPDNDADHEAEAGNEGESPNAAGFLAAFCLRSAAAEAGRPRGLDFGTDGAWRCASEEIDGWKQPGYDAGAWRPAVELGAADTRPWELRNRMQAAWSATGQYGRIRTVFVPGDPLTDGLGRPNREQVVTRRASAATTLQALEMTNGKTLADYLRRGAERLLSRIERHPAESVRRLFVHGLGREPGADELKIALEALGEPIGREGIEDLLWTVSMLPEFQLIY